VNISDRWAKTYTDLLIWKKAIEFVTKTYEISANFPKSERIGIVSQLRRAAVSIPSNIAEGFGRKSKADFARFCQIAMGSLFEVQTQLTISQNLGFITDSVYNAIFDDSREIERMISSFIDRLKG
jgi:four helix bundle protein